MKLISLILTLLYLISPQLSFADDLSDARKVLEIRPPKTIVQALPSVIRLANKHYSSAQAVLGYAYLFGNSLPKDNKKAIEWLTKASFGGLAGVQQGLAFAHAERDGIVLSRENNDALFRYAFDFIQKKSDKGNVAAIVALARMYERGEGVTKNLKKSFELNKEAALEGHRVAQYRLGRAYRYGDGTLEDYEKAFHWFSKAADQGSVDAMSSLSLYYYEKHGIEPNRKLRAKWSLMTALNGGFSAPKTMMLLYIDGNGVIQDYAEAYAWGLVYKQELDHDNDQLNDYLERLRSSLGRNGILKAQTRARELLSTIRENEARHFLSPPLAH